MIPESERLGFIIVAALLLGASLALPLLGFDLYRSFLLSEYCLLGEDLFSHLPPQSIGVCIGFPLLIAGGIGYGLSLVLGASGALCLDALFPPDSGKRRLVMKLAWSYIIISFPATIVLGQSLLW